MKELYGVSKLEGKGEKLGKYLNQKFHTETLLLDLLRCKELSQNDYNKMILDSESAYRQFLKDLHKQPIDESQIKIPFDEEMKDKE